MDTESKLYVAGHNGLAGSAILRRLGAGGYRNIVTRSHDALDLIDQRRVDEFFAQERPQYVFLAAAKVGGIQANATYPADFIYQNLLIQSNVIHAAYKHGVRKLLFLGTSCIYPKFAPQPMKEEYLLTGNLEATNEAYALAKIAGIKMCAAYNRQYRTNFLCAMPTNLYGPGDSYDLESAHVIPALIRKLHEAKVRDDAHAIIWGTGSPRREFLYADDFADACVFLMERHDAGDLGEFINVGTGREQTIRETAAAIAEVVGFRGQFVFDSAKPDGTPRKLLDSSRIKALGWTPRTELRDGLAKSYADYLARFCENADVTSAARNSRKP